MYDLQVEKVLQEIPQGIPPKYTDAEKIFDAASIDIETIDAPLKMDGSDKRELFELLEFALERRAIARERMYQLSSEDIDESSIPASYTVH